MEQEGEETNSSKHLIGVTNVALSQVPLELLALGLSSTVYVKKLDRQGGSYRTAAILLVLVVS